LAAASLIEDGQFGQFVEDRYAGWRAEFGSDVLAGRVSLEQAADHATGQGLMPTPRSGRQEYLENLVNRSC